MTVRWHFFDPTDSSSATFEINPLSDGSPTITKTITSQVTLAPGGGTIFSEGSATVNDFTFAGSILTQSMYDLLVTWFTKKHPVQLTDDLGRTFLIYITEFAPKRVRKAQVPWFHTYTVKAILLS